MLLILITGATALILEGSFLSHPFKIFIFLIGLYMTGGAANAFNQYFERDIDAKMSRTMARRPLPLNRISKIEAFVFSAFLGLTGFFILWGFFNFLTAALSLGTMVFYSLIYTLMLKPGTPQNIVIGGIAGAMPPIGAWAAATGTVSITSLILFLIVFLWTPPHFWALALRFKSDYEKSGLPMMPVVKGVDSTLRHIVAYSYLLVLSSLLYSFTGGGWIYTLVALTLGTMFIYRAHVAHRTKNDNDIWAVFKFSITYLFGLFGIMVVDKFILG